MKCVRSSTKYMWQTNSCRNKQMLPTKRRDQRHLNLTTNKSHGGLTVQNIYKQNNQNLILKLHHYLPNSILMLWNAIHCWTNITIMPKGWAISMIIRNKFPGFHSQLHLSHKDVTNYSALPQQVVISNLHKCKTSWNAILTRTLCCHK